MDAVGTFVEAVEKKEFRPYFGKYDGAGFRWH